MLHTFKRGSMFGMAGGAMMAMFAMIATAVSGDGFWAPVNAIAHAAWGGAPLDGSFSVGALILGMLVHMATAMMLAAGIAPLLSAVRGRPAKVAAATIAATSAWLVQLAIWPAIDQAGADSIPQGILLFGHVVFGMTVGLLLAIVPEHDHHRVGRPLAASVA